MTVAIVGLGYVGLPLAVAFAEAGTDVIGFDTDPAKLAAIRDGESYIEDIESDRLAAVGDRIKPTADPLDLKVADAIIVAVPTPLTDNREPDLAPLEAATGMLSGIVRAGQLVVLESTTYPGTTRERLIPALETATGMTVGIEFNVAFSPERVDPGRTDYTLRTTPKVVGGHTPACLERALDLYTIVCDHLVPVSTTEIAELSKLLENVFRSVNIALVNEVAMLCDRMNIDIWEVVDAASTKPYGFMRFEPGPGMGGHCLPVDPFYLSWKAREFDTPTEFIELAGVVNQRMPHFCVEKITRALNEHSKAVRGSRIAILGVSYKAGVGDLRESPALTIIEELQALGGELSYHDAYVPELPEYGLVSESLADATAGADAVVVVTAHPDIDWQQVVEDSRMLIDFRGVTRAIRAEHVVRL